MINNYSYKRVVNTCVVLLIAILVVAIKSLGEIDIENTLWAEDGSIFKNQSESLGWKSLITAYAGYLHTWPRVVALVSSFFDLQITPYIFFFGWFFSLVMAIGSVYFYGIKNNIPKVFLFLSCFLIFLVPMTGEVYFNITNSHWFLAIFLFLTVVLGENLGWLRSVFVFVASITGPFSIIIAPIFFVLCFFKENRIGFKGSVSYLSGLTVQLFFIVVSERNGSQVFNESISAWGVFFENLFSFGNDACFNSFLALIYWMVVCYSIFVVIKKSDLGERYKTLSIFVFGLLVLVASLWTFRGIPEQISPLGGGARYILIFYSMSAVFLIFMYSFRKNLSYIGLITLSVISYNNFIPYSHSENHFEEYATIHKEMGGFPIPISPITNSYPGWSINVKPFNLVMLREFSIPLAIGGVPNATMENANKIFWGDNRDPQIYFKNSVSCSLGKISAFVLEGDFSLKGRSQVFWSETGNMIEDHSATRFHEAGSVRLVFIIPSNGKKIQLRYDPPSGTNRLIIKRARFLCL